MPRTPEEREFHFYAELKRNFKHKKVPADILFRQLFLADHHGRTGGVIEELRFIVSRKFVLNPVRVILHIMLCVLHKFTPIIFFAYFMMCAMMA